MAIRNIEWKNYIKQVKNRLINNHYSVSNNETYYINGKKLSTQKTIEYNAIVAEIVASNDFIYNPIGRMIDYDDYVSLTEEGKMKYIFDLSKIYLSIKSKRLQ